MGTHHRHRLRPRAARTSTSRVRCHRKRRRRPRTGSPMRTVQRGRRRHHRHRIIRMRTAKRCRTVLPDTTTMRIGRTRVLSDGTWTRMQTRINSSRMAVSTRAAKAWPLVYVQRLLLSVVWACAVSGETGRRRVCSLSGVNADPLCSGVEVSGPFGTKEDARACFGLVYGGGSGAVA